MPKTTSGSTTKAATSKANAKTAKKGKGEKEKRPPTGYQLFVQANMANWRSEHPGASAKDAMKAMGAMWGEAPENPNRGKAKKSTAKSKVPKATTDSRSPASSSQPASDLKDNDATSSDPDDA